MKAPLERLRRRADFVAVASGPRASGGAFVLQARQRAQAGPARIGFTVSRKVGNAVERNRVRRRLRAVVRLMSAQSPDNGQRLHAGHDYVLVARRPALEWTFERLMSEFDRALRRVHATPLGAARATGDVAESTLHDAERRSPRRGRP